MSTESCVFCQIVDGHASHAKVYEDEATYAFMDINPATDGHLLVIPKKHSVDLLDISQDDLAATTLTAQRLARAVVYGLGADGVNLLNCCRAPAWQTVFHFHLHVIPRYSDQRDKLTLPWRPGVPGDPAQLATFAARLAEAAQ